MPTPPPAPPRRLVSLDAFRGMTVALMILVNNPGDWGHVYWPFLHAPWHGWTPTDVVFPFFLFIVGVAIPFSRRGTAGQALRRGAVLFGLGLFIAAYPTFDLATLRIPGVLQRIALCYVTAWLLHRVGRPWVEAVGAGGLLAAYWVLITRVTVPGGLPPNLEPETNLGAWLDRALMTGHLWRQSKTWDPEGVLSTLPAIATTLLGVLAGRWVKRDAPGPVVRSAVLMGAGLVLTVAGLAWGQTFPINKSLWTSSYVLLTGGLAAYCFGALFWIADVRGHGGWTRPFVIYGVNAILVFVASGLVAKTLVRIEIPGPAGVTPLPLWLCRNVFGTWLSPPAASLAYAVANVAAWFAVLRFLDRRGIHWKI
jgi:predicted acyltransferase